ncbi:PEP-CTERM sorting domain-containing protein [Duganella fentianensis]|uniref:PEP-CTERM sorting domain-containing protein n=1 Tax=Duganella fentianensis TaxID=2692177 RepID=UPI0032B16C72
MSKKFVMFLSTTCALLLAQVANAATYTFDYTYNGNSVTVNQSAAGSAIVAGDIVTATFHAASGGYWHVDAGMQIWTPQGMNETGDRIGDLSWTFLRQGTTVDSGASFGKSSQYVHIPQEVIASKTINFDTLTWTYTLTSSTAAGNTLNGGDFGSSNLTMLGATYVVGAVPEPETYGMLLAGLGLVGLAARRKKQAK